MWHERILSDSMTETGAEARCAIPADSFWFDGHFPDNPILPGVAQLALVLELIQSRLNRSDLTAAEIRRVRFKQMIGPEDPLVVTIAERPTQPGCYDFQIEKAAEVACCGMIAVRPRAGQESQPG